MNDCLTPRTHRVATAFALLVALVAAMLFSASAAHAGTGSGSKIKMHSRSRYESSIGTAVLHLINAERRAHHLRPLSADHDLMLSARRHDATMAHFNTMSHQLPGEAFFADRISAAGYRYSWAGENIAWNSRISTAGALQLEDLMYNEKAPNDEHRQNILSTHYANVGVDVFIDRAEGKLWLTTDFGHR